jgi:hypothetical protein
VDRQIEQLRMQGKVHVFKLGTGAAIATQPPPPYSSGTATLLQQQPLPHSLLPSAHTTPSCGLIPRPPPAARVLPVLTRVVWCGLSIPQHHSSLCSLHAPLLLDLTTPPLLLCHASSDVDEYAVLLSEDYTRLVQSAAASRQQQQGSSQASPAATAAAPPLPQQQQQPVLAPAPTQQHQQQQRAPPPAATQQPPATPSSSRLADLFLHHIVPACKGISVEKEELTALFQSATSSSSRRGAAPGSNSSSSRGMDGDRKAAAAR